MLKKISNITGKSPISKDDQKRINGGDCHLFQLPDPNNPNKCSMPYFASNGQCCVDPVSGSSGVCLSGECIDPINY